MVMVVAGNDSTSNASGDLVGTLPEGYRPVLNIRVANYDGKGHLSVATSGQVLKIANTSGVTTYLVGTCATFITTDAMPNS